MQLLDDGRRKPARLVERVFRLRELLVGGANRSLGGDQMGVAVRERRLARLQVHAPSRHLLGNRAVGLREVGQLGAERLQPRRRVLGFLLQTPLAVVRDLKPGFYLRAVHLRVRVRVARLVVTGLCRGEPLPRTGDVALAIRHEPAHGRVLTRVHVEPRAERPGPLAQPGRQRGRVVQLTLEPLQPALELALALAGFMRGALARRHPLVRRSQLLLSRPHLLARPLGVDAGNVARRGGGGELRFEREQLGATPQGTGARRSPRQPDGTPGVHEGLAFAQRPRTSEKGLHPAVRRGRDLELRRK